MTSLFINIIANFNDTFTTGDFPDTDSDCAQGRLTRFWTSGTTTTPSPGAGPASRPTTTPSPSGKCIMSTIRNKLLLFDLSCVNNVTIYKNNNLNDIDHREVRWGLLEVGKRDGKTKHSVCSRTLRLRFSETYDQCTILYICKYL